MLASALRRYVGKGLRGSSLAVVAAVLAGLSAAGGCGGPDCCSCLLVRGDCRAELSIPLTGDNCEEACVEQASVGSCNFTRDDIELAERADECAIPERAPDPVPDAGDADTGDPPEPALVTAVTAGFDHACALTEVGVIQCWGANTSGELGTGSTSILSVAPVAVANLAGPAEFVEAGGAHTCALLSGRAWCWGTNSGGVLGDGTTRTDYAPVEVVGLESELVDISGGARHTCAVTIEGAVLCWGDNQDGELGDGTRVSSLTPVNVVGLDTEVIAVAAGGSHTCALTAAGGVKCWGANHFAQLGNGTLALNITPGDVLGLESGVVAIDTNGSNTCALTDEPAVFCWGFNSYGQVGDGTEEDASLPVQVSGLGANPSAVACSGAHCCAVDDDGVACWGGNSDGALGDGTTDASSRPVRVAGLDVPIAAIAAGAAFTCAVGEAGQVYCWGDIAGAESTPTEVPVWR